MMDDLRPDHPVKGLECLQWAYREALEWWLIGGSLGVLLGFAILFALVGHVGFEDRLIPIERVGYWTVSALICWPLCYAFGAGILYVMRSHSPVVIALAAVGGTLFFTLPCTGVAHVVYGLFDPEEAGDVTLLQVYVDVVLMALACSALVHYVVCQRVEVRYASAGSNGTPGYDTAEGDAESAEETAPPDGDFYDRVPRALGRDVVYLSVSGHYLNVVTTAGSCLVLMRLSDAVAVLGDLGMPVHRSHWVAHRHVTGILRRGPRTVVRVTGPHELPVSRSHVAIVRRALRSREA